MSIHESSLNSLPLWAKSYGLKSIGFGRRCHPVTDRKHPRKSPRISNLNIQIFISKAQELSIFRIYSLRTKNLKINGIEAIYHPQLKFIIYLLEFMNIHESSLYY